MRYGADSVPVGAGMLLINERRRTVQNEGSEERKIRLSIDATLRDEDGNYIAHMVQKGFSELSAATGGKIYEY